jgi:hypothetical protein
MRNIPFLLILVLLFGCGASTAHISYTGSITLPFGDVQKVSKDKSKKYKKLDVDSSHDGKNTCDAHRSPVALPIEIKKLNK